MESRKVNSQQILSMAKIGIWRVEWKTGNEPCFYADEIMDELLGVTSDLTPEERYEFHRKHIHPADLELFLDYSNKLIEMRTEIVYRYIHPQWGEMFVRCAGGRDLSVIDCVSLVGTHQDISDTVRLEHDKQAELRLGEMNNVLRQKHAQQEDYYRELLDLQSCGVMAYTIPDYRMCHMNSEALRIYNMKSVEQAQMELREVLSEVYYPQKDTKEKLRSLREHDGSLNYEAVVYRGKPYECHIMASTNVLYRGSGERVVVTTFMDVSEINLLRNALLAAQNANRAKTMFLNNMSHDIRTPMNAIIGFTSLAASHLDDPQQVKDYLQKISVSSEHLLALINDVLDMSRIESGRVELDEKPVCLSELVHDIRTIVQPTIDAKRLDFVIDTAEVRDEDIIGDKLRLNQILLNILSNGVKFNKVGGMVSLRIKQMDKAPEGYASYQFIIKDTGIGMKEEFVNQIFDAFAREETSTVSGIPGTGLGMSIAKNIVDIMGGTIEVRSQKGIGSEFVVSLSFRLNENENAGGVRRVTGDGKLRKHDAVDFAGKKVLLVEDNQLNQEIATTILREMGMVVEAVADGAIAVAKMKQASRGQYDLIFMDIQMPFMDGYEATRQIRMLPDDEIASTPVIAMTANVFSADQERALSAGMNGYLTKPVDVKRLTAVLSEVLG